MSSDPGVRATSATLPTLLDELAVRHAEREALISARGRVRFRELSVLASRVAGALAARGVGRGTRVGLLLPNWPEWLAIAFGVWRCGGVLVPISTLYRPRELAHALDLTLTAEGVTRTEQHGALHALGCDTAQGYLYGRPTTATRLEAELHRTGLRVAQPCATQLGATTTSG